MLHGIGIILEFSALRSECKLNVRESVCRNRIGLQS